MINYNDLLEDAYDQAVSELPIRHWCSATRVTHLEAMYGQECSLGDETVVKFHIDPHWCPDMREASPELLRMRQRIIDKVRNNSFII